MTVEAHVENQLQDFLSDRLHCVALPEQVLNGRRVPDRNEAAVDINSYGIKFKILTLKWVSLMFT